MNKNERKQWFVFERRRTFSCSKKIIPYVDIKWKHPKLSKYKNCISFDLREELQKKITFNDFAVLWCQAAIFLHLEPNKTMTGYVVVLCWTSLPYVDRNMPKSFIHFMINSQALGLTKSCQYPWSNGHSDFFMLRKPSLSLLERCIQIVAGKWQAIYFGEIL